MVEGGVSGVGAGASAVAGPIGVPTGPDMGSGIGVGIGNGAVSAEVVAGDAVADAAPVVGTDQGLVDLQARLGQAAGISAEAPVETGTPVTTEAPVTAVSTPITTETPVAGTPATEATGTTATPATEVPKSGAAETAAPAAEAPKSGATETVTPAAEAPKPSATEAATKTAAETTAQQEAARAVALRQAQLELLEEEDAVLTPEMARLGLLALAGKGRVGDVAAEAVRIEISRGLRTVPLSERTAIGKVIGIAGIPFAPLDGRRHGVLRASIQSAKETADSRGEKIDALGSKAMDLLRHGSPQMRALALDLELGLDLQKLALMPAGEPRTKFEAEVTAKAVQRKGLTSEDGKVLPNQFSGLAKEVAAILESGGELTGLDKSNPVTYLQQQLGNVMLDGKARKVLIAGLQGAGRITDADAKQFDKMLRLPYNNTKIQTVKSAIESTGIMGIGGALLLWLQMKMGKNRGGRAAAHA